MISLYAKDQGISDVKNGTYYVLTGPECRDLHPLVVELAGVLLEIPEVGPIVDVRRPNVLEIVTTERANIMPLTWQVDIMAAYKNIIRNYAPDVGPSCHLVRAAVIDYSERDEDNIEYVKWILDVTDADDPINGRDFRRILNDTLNRHLPRRY